MPQLAMTLSAAMLLETPDASLAVVVDDFDTPYERAKAGANVIVEPFNTYSGSRDYSVKDDDGHL